MAHLNVWTNQKLALDHRAELEHRISPHRLLVSESPSSTADPLLMDVDIAFGQPNPQQVIQTAKLRWIHLSTAGYTRYDRDDLRSALRDRGATLTNSSSVFDDPCAQHVLAMMLAMSRQLPGMLDNQRSARLWSKGPLRGSSRLLGGQTVLLVGFGAIATRLAQLLAPFEMNLIGIRRKIHGDEPIRMMSTGQIDEALPQADHVVNTLPASGDTAGFFSAERIARMKSSASFYNVGRGSTVDQAALRTALENGRLAAAYLDVTTPEPLPPEDPLWTTRNCYITPHSAGGHSNEPQRLIAHFAENLARFERGEDLRDRII